MRTDRLAIPFGQIAIVFGVSKEPIVQHYQQSRTEQKAWKGPEQSTNWLNENLFVMINLRQIA
jgi:hypothetical protein